MDSSFSTSSPRRTHELPKPETGLAEWTSKIKAMQREVDADEEAEQKRLEEEIAAAREARLRRSSRGYGSRANSVDISSTKDQLNNINDNTSSDAPKTATERANDQETALRKLMGRNDVYNPDKVTSVSRGSEKQDPVSLAAFIGGRATGPRLNKYAAQPDAHDPTQYIQPDLSAPHPVFGKGGIAMPGMVTKKAASSPAVDVGSEHSERCRPTLSAAKSTSALGASYLQKIGTSANTKLEEPEVQRRPISTGNAYNVTAPLRVQKTGDRPPSASPPVEADAPAATTAFNDVHTQPVASDSSIKTASVASSYLDRKEEPKPKPTSSFTKSTDSFRSNQNAFSASPRTYSYSSSSSSLSSYLPKKEEAPAVTSPKSPAKPTDTFRSVSSVTASQPLPSYLPSTKLTKSTSADPQTAGQSKANTPLRRLMETNNVYNPDKEPARKSIAERAQNVSLAGFIGGNAKGVRLNRPAPQPDVHDPTQFIQPDTSAPHPIFGRGGIAMPGMVTRRSPDSSVSQPNATGNENNEGPRPPSSTVKKVTWPPVQPAPQVRPVSPQKTGGRERTTSAPNAQVANVSTSYSSSAWASSDKAVDRNSFAKESTPATSVRERTISGPSYHVASTVSTPSRSVTVPSLARPIQPRPKSTSFSPQLPATATTPSPAFQRPPPQKELTPSISRLQGRGFVQNILQAAKFEAPASPSPPVDKPPRPLSAGGKRNSVLDRWQPQAQSTSPTKSTFPSNGGAGHTPISQSSRSTSSLPSFHVNEQRTGHLAGSSTSIPQTPSKPMTEVPADVIEPYQRSRTPGLGSATTMVLIKPSKSVTDLAQLRHVDELGVKHIPGQSRKDVGHFDDPSDNLPSSKKPLIHPTKYRPRKLKKSSEVDTSKRSAPVEFHETEDVLKHSPILPDARAPSPDNAVTLTSPLTSDSIAVPLAQQESALSAPLGDLEVPAQHQHLPDFAEGKSRKEEAERSPQESQNDDLLKPKEETPAIVPAPSFRKPSPLSAPSSLVKPKHVRIPSTGNRPTVMEVAQALLENPINEVSSPISNEEEEVDDVPPPVEFLAKPRHTLSQLQAEKRRSSYERYSAIILPPLKEEATPTPSPAGTLSRTQPLELNRTASEDTAKQVIETSPKPEAEDTGHLLVHSTTSNDVEKEILSETTPVDIDVTTLLGPTPKYSLPEDEQTVSVEVLVVKGTTATPLSRNLDVFYDSEILSIIHRTKSKSSGLANTSVWCWLGRKSILGDREGRKINDLAKRYGTTAKIIHQLAEPPELIHILGGQLAIRQGARAHWSSDNTTMHLIRSLHGCIIIDEHDLSMKNLCSAFSYCFTLLGSIYIWHGCGSTDNEREAALKYVQTFSPDPITPIVLVEGEDDEDEMFWMMLGNEEYAKADYWRWRRTTIDTDPKIWRVEADDGNHSITPITFISIEPTLQKSVYAVNFTWEFFVIVGKEARANKHSIKLAIDIVLKMASTVAPQRPYFPTVHVLIVPSQIPLDLRLGTRDLDEAWLNDGDIPDHMNLLHCSDALKHLATPVWNQTALKDPSMLPLGVGNVDM
ncbi:hypothetical protein CPC08DRAFT_815295 [Agrocybe pediades]|nr:hypothetical protein CPC08DRAFT_815295 [Agrocybe pediades]